jgi:hypothetical protein
MAAMNSSPTGDGADTGGVADTAAGADIATGIDGTAGTAFDCAAAAAVRHPANSTDNTSIRRLSRIFIGLY